MWRKGGHLEHFPSSGTKSQTEQWGDRRLPPKPPLWASHPPLDPPFQPVCPTSPLSLLLDHGESGEEKINNSDNNLGQVSLGYYLFPFSKQIQRSKMTPGGERI